MTLFLLHLQHRHLKIKYHLSLRRVMNPVINWNGDIPPTITKRLRAESKNWNICSVVDIEGGVNETRICFRDVCISVSLIHQYWVKYLSNIGSNHNHYRKVDIRFLESILKQSSPVYWNCCRQLDRSGLVVDFLGVEEKRWGGFFSVFIAPWLFNVTLPSCSTMTFSISNHYPFRGVTNVLVGENKTEYSRMLCNHHSVSSKYYREIVRGCLCCQSLTCSDSWHPQLQIYMVLLEVLQTIKTRRRICDRTMADRVVNLWTPWKRDDGGGRMLWASYIPTELRLRGFL